MYNRKYWSITIPSISFCTLIHGIFIDECTWFIPINYLSVCLEHVSIDSVLPKGTSISLAPHPSVIAFTLVFKLGSKSLMLKPGYCKEESANKSQLAVFTESGRSLYVRKITAVKEQSLVGHLFWCIFLKRLCPFN